MKFYCTFILFLLTACFAILLPAKEKKYDDNDIKRILYLKKPHSSAPVRYVILNRINNNQFECTYLGTQQTVTVYKNNVVPLIFYEDTSNFIITQYALFSMFTGQRPNLAMGLAQVNNDTTGRMITLSNFHSAVQATQSQIAFIRKKLPQNSNEQANALADLISKDKTLSLVKQAATSNDWFLAITLLDSYKENILQQYTRFFANMPDITKEAQMLAAQCENELLINFNNRMQQPNVRRTLFLQLYPKARGLWSQIPPMSYEQLRSMYIRSMNSYLKLENISKIFNPQDWGSAMLDTLLFLEGAACAAELEREFDDEMRRLLKRARRP